MASVASDRAFARARARLRVDVLGGLNDRLIERAQAVVPLWRGLRVVAADASVLAPAVRHCHAPRTAASSSRRAAHITPGSPGGDQVLQGAQTLNTVHRIILSYFDHLSTRRLRLQSNTI